TTVTRSTWAARTFAASRPARLPPTTTAWRPPRVLPVPASSCAVCIASAPGWHIVRKRQYRPYGRAIDGFRLFGTDCRWPFGGCGSNRRAVIPRFGGTPVRRFGGTPVRRLAVRRFGRAAVRG